MEQKTKLTKEILYEMGFHGEGKSFTGKPWYRKKVSGYHYELQIELGDYPDDNPNSGILMLHDDPITAAHMFTSVEEGDKMKLDYIECEEDGIKYGIKYIDVKEINFPIAWHVNTRERLESLINSITNGKDN